MTTRFRWLHIVIVVVAIVIAQVETFDQTLLVNRVRLDLPLYLLVGIGFVSRSDEALLLGFVIGLAVDLFQFSPFGLNALLFGLVGWVLAEARVRMLQPGTSFRTVQGALAAIAITAVSWFAGTVFNQDPPPFNNATLINLGVIGIVGAVLVHPATFLAGWMIDTSIGAQRGGAADAPSRTVAP